MTIYRSKLYIHQPGQFLHFRTLPSASGDIQTTVDVSAWSPGIYFISRLKRTGRVWVEKVVIY